MNLTFKFAFFILGIAIAFAAPIACTDKEDDDQEPLSGEEEEPIIRGVCYWECENEEGTQHETICYGQGSEAITDSALETEEDCRDMGQSYCDSIKWALSQFHFDTDCKSCEAESCRPDWLDDYGD